MTPSTDTIRHRMQQVRCDLGNDVGEIVESTREMTDWRAYVRRYPWVCLGLAALVGYAVMPKRVEIVSPDANAFLELARKNKLVVNTDSQPHAKSGLAGMAVSLIANAAMRSAVAYAGQQLGKIATERAVAANRE